MVKWTFFCCSISISLSAEPDAAPENVTAIAITSTEIEFSWQEVPPIDHNGIITTYEIEFMPLNTFGGTLVAETVNVSSTVLKIELTALEEYVEYNISVRAYTSVGPGPYSDGVMETTLEDGGFDYFPSS